MLIPVNREPLGLYRDASIEWRPDGVKMNPNSLRFLFGAILKFYFAGMQSRAVKRMQQLRSRFVHEKDDEQRKKMTPDAMTEILKDRVFIHYWHIEAFSHSIGLPTGALLSLSHLLSLAREGEKEAAVAFAQALRCFAERLEIQAKSQVLDKVAMDQMVGCFDQFREMTTRSDESPHEAKI
jgi:hypothetical protein